MLICPFRSTSFITSWSFCGFTQAGLWHKVWSSTKEGTFEVATGFHSATTRRWYSLWVQNRSGMSRQVYYSQDSKKWGSTHGFSPSLGTLMLLCSIGQGILHVSLTTPAQSLHSDNCINLWVQAVLSVGTPWWTCIPSRRGKQGRLLSDWLICYPSTQTLFECALLKIWKTKMATEGTISCWLCIIACWRVSGKCWRFFTLSSFSEWQEIVGW